MEATGQGPALISDIRAQQGMEIVPITPHEDKVSRLLKHRNAIRSGIVALPEGARWVAEFIDELVQFPYGHFDDQVDAMTQFLDWIVGASAPSQAAASSTRSCDRLERNAPPTSARGCPHNAMPRRGFCPRSSTLVTVETHSVQNLASRSGVLAATRAVDAQIWWALPCQQSIRLTGMCDM